MACRGATPNRSAVGQLPDAVHTTTPSQTLWDIRHPAALRLFVLLLSVASTPYAATVAAEEPEELEDVLSGFEVEEEIAVVEDSTRPPSDAARFWDLTGSVSLATSINYLDHHSATGTNYTGLQKLRTRLNLQLDLALPRDWKGRLAGYGFYDSAYRIQGRREYTDEVLDEYEWETDFQEVYVQGSLTDDLDLKVGRQIINWGRSDTLRVLDILNPIDNREPGLADIEDLRLAVTMVRLDYYWREWTFTATAIPEIRFNKDPPLGSDFFPFASKQEVPREQEPSDSFDNTEWAAAATGIFHGWDLSVHVAYYWDDLAHTTTDPLGLLGEHSRVTLVGSGGNLTFGNWLLKGELAYLDGVEYTVGDSATEITGTVEKSRIDVMGGVEYYGFDETLIAVEVADRHIIDFEQRMRPFDAREDSVETALRIEADFLNARLHTTALGVIFGERAQDGSVVRLEATYELRDALLVTGGLLLYQNGDPITVSDIGRNDRLFAEIKYSF